MGSEFSGSHRRLCTPSDTFTNFYRWIHIFNQEYRVFHPRGYLSLLAIPNTRIFHFLFLLCDRETQFGCCPILTSPPSNTKHSVNLSHALISMSCDVPCINAMQCHCMYLMLHTQGMPCAIVKNHTSCQVSWIIIFNTYNYSHLISIYLTHISQHASQYNKHVFHFSCISSIYQHQLSIIQVRITWYPLSIVA